MIWLCVGTQAWRHVLPTFNFSYTAFPPAQLPIGCSRCVSNGKLGIGPWNNPNGYTQAPPQLALRISWRSLRKRPHTHAQKYIHSVTRISKIPNTELKLSRAWCTTFLLSWGNINLSQMWLQAGQLVSSPDPLHHAPIYFIFRRGGTRRVWGRDYATITCLMWSCGSQLLFTRVDEQILLWSDYRWILWGNSNSLASVTML